MNYKDLLKVDVGFWMEYIVRYLAPMIAFLITAGLFVYEYGQAFRTTLSTLHTNWITPNYEYSLSKR